MSETFATSRPQGGAEEFDRRRRSLGGMPEGQPDPLAELARLVGQNDPFRSAKPQIRQTIPPTAATGSTVPPRDAFADFDREFRGAIDAGEEAGAPDDPAVVHPRLERAAPQLRPAIEQPAAAALQEPRAPEVSADSWARGLAPAVEPQDSEAAEPAPAGQAGSSKRTLIVLAAVMALTAGGLAASFLAKPTGGVAVSSAATPTILAATGPSKVQPAPAADADAPSEPSTLLDKNKNDGTATAKVVNSVEQPVDLAQAVKPAAGADATPVPAPPSPFPEPRKVKTVLVRPDGSIISDRPAAPVDNSAGQGSTADQQTSLAFDPKTALPVPSSPPQDNAAAASTPAEPPPAAPVPAAATPASAKSQARVAVTPKASAPAPATTQAARPPAAAPKPAEEANAVAPAADTPTASLPSGKFAAQLGAAGSEAEARDLTARLSKKFAEVAGRLSVHKAQSGSKTVYRLRVSGLSQEAAKALCGKVSAGGGGCFVARD